MLKYNPHVRRIVRLAVEEDLGTGDVTTAATIPAEIRVEAEVLVKEAGVFCGLEVAPVVLEEVDPALEMTPVISDGADVLPGDVALRIRGPARSMLVAERTLLNFLMRLSGIATTTRGFLKALDGTRTTLLDTRKTTPGLRVLEKYAVRVGGARNHRLALDSGVLIKNNHLAIGGDLKDVVRRAKATAPVLCRIEVEVRTLDEARRAIEAGADVLLLDHMDNDAIAAVVDYADWKVLVEVSGNMTPKRAAEVAAIGVDFVSAGAITHSAPWMDLSLAMRVATSSETPSS
jgi:nicotinate-nucleotide pyrophosphorylase (carboxylating)